MTEDEALDFLRMIHAGAVVHFTQQIYPEDPELQFVLAVQNMQGLYLTKAMKVRALRYLLSRAEDET